MNFLSLSDQIEKIENVGGKGHHLQKLVAWKAPIPPFFIITTSSHDYFSRTGEIPQIVIDHIQSFLNKNPNIVLRSSMIGEDHQDDSFAGMFETILGVNNKTWKENLKKIYASLQAPRVKEYIQKKNIKTALKMAIVVQREIQVDKSGVLFTRTPVEPTSAMAIDAAFGMGEGVVSGLTHVDHYLYTRLGEKIYHIKNNINPVLDSEDIKILLKEGLRLEDSIGKPSDIEWGFKQGKLYIFQIRPITRHFLPLKVFVDTNLSESYPGTVSPFTATFVKKAYENVFTESAIILGAKGKKLENLKIHYAQLIASIDDHLFYNLEHYYAVLRSLPGGEKNINNWHQMIGGKISDIKIPHHDTNLSKSETFWAIVKLLKLGFKKNQIYQIFLNQLSILSENINQEREKFHSSKETLSYLCQLIEKPLGFGVTVINDVYIMMGLGYLTKVMKGQGRGECETIDLLKTIHGIDSVKPLIVFNELVDNLSNEFIELFSSTSSEIGFDPYTAIFKTMEDKGWENEVKKIKSFLEKYGDRSFEELKLESLPLKNNPPLLKKLLRWAKDNPDIKRYNTENTSKVSLGFIDKKILDFTRECIEMREASRLWRGRFYQLLRELIIQASWQLTKEDGRFQNWTLSDFFSINYHEWAKFNSSLINYDILEKLMKDRKQWQTKKIIYPELIYWVEDEKLPHLELPPTLEGELKGQGVSPGIVEGVALVLDNPNDALESNLKNFILITKNTDPAWVYIMSRSMGLISEKGSMLSHTAIIGRELSIPTLVGVKNATQLIKSGDKIRINGQTGLIKFL